jgi:hypothetical protein
MLWHSLTIVVTQTFVLLCVQILEAEKLGGGLALTIAVMFEASLGTASKW